MSSFIVHTNDAQGKPEEIFLTPRAVVSFMRPPDQMQGIGQIPAWAKCIIVDPSGTAIPVLEEPIQVASLLAMATQSMWFGYRYDGDSGNIWMQRYDSEAAGVEVSIHEGRSMGQFQG